MALYIKDKEVTGVFFGNRIITAIYYGRRLLWILGNLFSKNGDVLLTADKEVLEIKE